MDDDCPAIGITVYRTPKVNGTPRVEFVIPVERLKEFNEPTVNRTWLHKGKEGGK
ncbi:hypothetical protein ABT224_22965 [Streptomyces sp. NPDC001584]|uniref:hypothetical protein n=1 Tax=Streptomyces sp. NPDC001584 TaxID=3154521 RepID=UPI0033245007